MRHHWPRRRANGLRVRLPAAVDERAGGERGARDKEKGHDRGADRADHPGVELHMVVAPVVVRPPRWARFTPPEAIDGAKVSATARWHARIRLARDFDARALCAGGARLRVALHVDRAERGRLEVGAELVVVADQHDGCRLGADVLTGDPQHVGMVTASIAPGTGPARRPAARARTGRRANRRRAPASRTGAGTRRSGTRGRP